MLKIKIKKNKTITLFYRKANSTLDTINTRPFSLNPLKAIPKTFNKLQTTSRVNNQQQYKKLNLMKISKISDIPSVHYIKI